MKNLVIAGLMLGFININLFINEVHGTTKTLKKIKVAEVIKHNSKESCWIVIDKKVYDITKYLTIHPAPLEILLKYCGKDGTKGYNTKGLGQPHSENASKLLTSFIIGELDI